MSGKRVPEGSEVVPDTGWDRFIGLGLELVRTAESRGLTLRLLGSVGCRAHCPEFGGRLDALGRGDPPDVDLVTSSADRSAVRSMLRELGYEEDRDMLVAMEGRRFAFRHPVHRVNIDLFVDRLEFCHPIDVTGRFSLDTPTLPLADLLLSKLQIVEINEKDLQDLAVLLLEHGCGHQGREEVDASYIARLASEDWGLYHTIRLNADRLRTFLRSASALSEREKDVVGARLDEVWRRIEETPKSLRWRVRAKVGARVRWYQEVAEKEPTF